MELILPKEQQQSPPSFEGDIEQLKLGLASRCAKLSALIDASDGEMHLLILVGHPGTGKSTLLKALEALELPDSLSTFHNDAYIDWEKVIAHVDAQDGMTEQDYVPTANRAALKLMLSEKHDKKIVFVDGGGLLEDYSKICSELSLPHPNFVVLDASTETLNARLAKRGDGFVVTEKETQEHKKNLQDLEKFKGLRISTDNASLEDPSSQLEALLDFTCKSLQRTTP